MRGGFTSARWQGASALEGVVGQSLKSGTCYALHASLAASGTCQGAVFHSAPAVSPCAAVLGWVFPVTLSALHLTAMHCLRLPRKTTATFRRSPRDERMHVMRKRLPARMAKARAVLEWVERSYGIVPTTINFLDLLNACHEVGSDAAAEHAVSIIRHMQVRATAAFLLAQKADHCCVSMD